MKSGERGRNRTYNLLIKSQLLCQLSYAPGNGPRIRPAAESSRGGASPFLILSKVRRLHNSPSRVPACSIASEVGATHLGLRPRLPRPDRERLRG
jgi:hypothetical protein